MNYKSLSKESILHFSIFGLLLFALNYLTDNSKSKKEIIITKNEVNLLIANFQKKNTTELDPSILNILIEMEIYTKILKEEKIHPKFMYDQSKSGDLFEQLNKKRRTDYSVRVDWDSWKNNQHSL